MTCPHSTVPANSTYYCIPRLEARRDKKRQHSILTTLTIHRQVVAFSGLAFFFSPFFTFFRFYLIFFSFFFVFVWLFFVSLVFSPFFTFFRFYWIFFRILFGLVR